MFAKQFLQLEGWWSEVGGTQGGDTHGSLPHMLPPWSLASPSAFVKILLSKKFSKNGKSIASVAPTFVY